jgi:hypothetical protein
MGAAVWAPQCYCHPPGEVYRYPQGFVLLKASVQLLCDRLTDNQTITLPRLDNHKTSIKMRVQSSALSLCSLAVLLLPFSRAADYNTTYTGYPPDYCK